MRTTLLIGLTVLAGSAMRASERVFTSGPAPVALIELYTSEGCSSCPPAEKWLAGLRDEAGLWRNFVPVAFHVNYWDHLGWRDALASAAFTAREHAYAAAWRADSVYTPCFVRDGAEWRPPARLDAVKADVKRPAAAGLLRLSPREPGKWRLEFTPPAGERAENYTASIALLGGGITTAVRAGENRGRELRHEFVALRLETMPLAREAASGGEGGPRSFAAEVTLAPRTDVKSTRLAVAAWITRRGELAPVQAVGGWLE